MRWINFQNILSGGSSIDRFLGRYKSEEFCSLIERWNFGNPTNTLLKTDLQEEVAGTDQILFSLGYPQESMYGIDRDPSAVAAAHSRSREKGFIHRYLAADVRSLPFKGGVFDLIISSSTVDHFKTDKEFKTALSELARVMSSRGVLILAVNNRSNFWFRWMVAFGEKSGLIRQPNRFFRKKTLEDACRSAGLQVEKTDYIVHIISPLNTVLLFLRRFMPERFVNFLASVSVEIALLLGANHATTSYTGWFIALKCKKDPGKESLSANPAG